MPGCGTDTSPAGCLRPGLCFSPATGHAAQGQAEEQIRLSAAAATQQAKQEQDPLLPLLRIWPLDRDMGKIHGPGPPLRGYVICHL